MQRKLSLSARQLTGLLAKANHALIHEENIDLVYCLSQSSDAALAPVLKRVLEEYEEGPLSIDLS